MNQLDIHIPDLCEGADLHRSWRRVLTDSSHIDDGQELAPGATVSAPVGTLLLSVDQTLTGWGTHYQTGRSYPLMSAQVRWYLVTDAGISRVGQNHFKAAKSVYSVGVANKSQRLLERHPVPSGEIAVLTEGRRRANLKAGECMWCGDVVAKDSGYVVGRGPDAEIEHRECPRRTADRGSHCALCGVEVVPNQAEQVLLRDGSGTWQTRHRPRIGHRPCTEESIATPEQQEQLLSAQREADRLRREAERAAQAKATAQKVAAAETRRAARVEKRRLQVEEAEAVQARVESGRVVSSTATEETSKGLGGNARALLHRVDATLDDGGPASWWTVTVSGDTDQSGSDAPIYDHERARDRYRDLHFDPAPRYRAPTRHWEPPLYQDHAVNAESRQPGSWSLSRTVGANTRSEAGAPAFRTGEALRVTVTERLDDPALADAPGRIQATDLGRPAISAIFVVTAVHPGRPYDSDDGNGSGTGYPWEANQRAFLRPAAHHEALPTLQQEARTREHHQLGHRRRALLNRSAADALHPTAEELNALLEGVDLQRIRMEHDTTGYRYESLWQAEGWPFLLAAVENGADGDAWAASNYGGRIARLLPVTPERAELVAALARHFGQMTDDCP